MTPREALKMKMELDMAWRDMEVLRKRFPQTWPAPTTIKKEATNLIEQLELKTVSLPSDSGEIVSLTKVGNMVNLLKQMFISAKKSLGKKVPRRKTIRVTCCLSVDGFSFQKHNGKSCNYTCASIRIVKIGESQTATAQRVCHTPVFLMINSKEDQLGSIVRQAFDEVRKLEEIVLAEEKTKLEMDYVISCDLKAFGIINRTKNLGNRLDYCIYGCCRESRSGSSVADPLRTGGIPTIEKNRDQVFDSLHLKLNLCKKLIDGLVQVSAQSDDKNVLKEESDRVHAFIQNQLRLHKAVAGSFTGAASDKILKHFPAILKDCFPQFQEDKIKDWKELFKVTRFIVQMASKTTTVLTRDKKKLETTLEEHDRLFDKLGITYASYEHYCKFHLLELLGWYGCIGNFSLQSVEANNALVKDTIKHHTCAASEVDPQALKYLLLRAIVTQDY